MFVSRHIFFGIILSILLFIFFPTLGFFPIAIIFLSSVLIDVDHYFYYLIQTRELSLAKAYNWYMERWKKLKNIPKEKIKEIYSGLFLFHGIEWLILLFLLGTYVNNFFILVFFGFLFHFILDILHEIYFKGFTDKFSLIYSYSRFRKLNH